MHCTCNLHRRLAGTRWGAHCDVLQTSTTGFATCSWRIEQSSIKRKEKKTVAQLWGIGKTKAVKVLQADRQVLELENSGAALAGVVHESTLHSQLLTTDKKKLQQCRGMFAQICGKEKQQSKNCFRTKAEFSTPTIFSTQCTESAHAVLHLEK